MTTTTTTLALGGFGGLGGLAAGAAVAGAVGLGLAGLAALAGSRGGGNNRKQKYHRHHREVEGDSSNLKSMMEFIRREDVTGCGLKLMCELASENPEDLIDEELAILGLVGPALVPGEDLRNLGALGEYREAKGIGLNKGHCGQSFVMCPLNGTQLMDTVMGFLP